MNKDKISSCMAETMQTYFETHHNESQESLKYAPWQLSLFAFAKHLQCNRGVQTIAIS